VEWVTARASHTRVDTGGVAPATVVCGLGIHQDAFCAPSLILSFFARSADSAVDRRTLRTSGVHRRTLPSPLSTAKLCRRQPNSADDGVDRPDSPSPAATDGLCRWPADDQCQPPNSAVDLRTLQTTDVDRRIPPSPAVTADSAVDRRRPPDCAVTGVDRRTLPSTEGLCRRPTLTAGFPRHRR
jgi:hypothetical protein